MKLPAIDLRPTPQNMQDRKRTEILLESEEEQHDVPKKLRALISRQTNKAALHTVIDRINGEYMEGRLSNKMLKRCGIWITRRLEELRTPRRTR